MAKALFRIQGKSTYNVFKDTYFPVALSDKLLFIQGLACASKHRDRMLGLRNASAITSKYLAASSQAINEYISNPLTRYSDEVICAVGAAAYIEHADGRGHAFQVHIRALWHMLRQRRKSSLPLVGLDLGGSDDYLYYL